MNRQCHWLLLLCFLLPSGLPALAQHIDWKLETEGFFDNSEGDATYRATTTHAGLDLSPQVSFVARDARHQFVAGWNANTEMGHDDFTSHAPIAYYQYEAPALTFRFGHIPRSTLHEQLPDYLVCDSIRYYRSLLAGFSLLYTYGHGHVEAYLDWVQKRTETEREQFMATLAAQHRMGPWQAGLQGYYYHYALELHGKQMNHCIHDNFVAHPYVALDLSRHVPVDSLRLSVGALLQADRDHRDNVWHLPAGFVGEVQACWRGFTLCQTVYAGQRQQHFGNEAFGLYYWGDTYVQAPWFSKTALISSLFSTNNIAIQAQLSFNLTQTGLNWHQMLTMSYAIGGRLCRIKER